MLLALGPDRDEELLQSFAGNLDGQQLGGSGEVAGAVAGGSALVGVTLEETALKRIAAGDDLAQFCRRSVRGDIPSDLTPLEDIPLVDYNVEQASLDRDAILMTWAFYLGGEGET